MLFFFFCYSSSIRKKIPTLMSDNAIWKFFLEIWFWKMVTKKTAVTITWKTSITALHLSVHSINIRLKINHSLVVCTQCRSPPLPAAAWDWFLLLWQHKRIVYYTSLGCTYRQNNKDVQSAEPTGITTRKLTFWGLVQVVETGSGYS